MLPGLNIPKGLEPLLPMYQKGILSGSPTLREVAALGLSDLLSITSAKYLPPALMIKITGPLLRVVGDRNQPPVKIAIVQTLGLILTKGGMVLRAFVPQFQTTVSVLHFDPLINHNFISHFYLNTAVCKIIKRPIEPSKSRSNQSSRITHAAVY